MTGRKQTARRHKKRESSIPERKQIKVADEAARKAALESFRKPERKKS